MTEIRLENSKAKIVYRKGSQTKELEVENPLAWLDAEGVYRPGGLWAYEVLGQRERYLRTVRKRHLRQTFGIGVPIGDLPLLASPFRVELLRRDAEGCIGVVQAGTTVYLVSSWGVMQAPLPLAQTMHRNRTVRLRGDRLRALAKQPARLIWQEAVGKGFEAFLDEVLAYGEDYTKGEK